MTPEQWIKVINALGPMVVLFYCVWQIVRYRLNRKFKKDYADSRFRWLLENTVEILIFMMFVAVAAPDWGSLIFNTAIP